MNVKQVFLDNEGGAKIRVIRLCACLAIEQPQNTQVLLLPQHTSIPAGLGIQRSKCCKIQPQTQMYGLALQRRVINTTAKKYELYPAIAQTQSWRQRFTSRVLKSRGLSAVNIWLRRSFHSFIRPGYRVSFHSTPARDSGQTRGTIVNRTCRTHKII